MQSADDVQAVGREYMYMIMHICGIYSIFARLLAPRHRQQQIPLKKDCLFKLPAVSASSALNGVIFDNLLWTEKTHFNSRNIATISLF